MADGEIARDAYRTLPHFSHKRQEFVVKHDESQLFHAHRHGCALSRYDICYYSMRNEKEIFFK